MKQKGRIPTISKKIARDNIMMIIMKVVMRALHNCIFFEEIGFSFKTGLFAVASEMIGSSRSCIKKRIFIILLLY
jgi:hypothetical protein